LLHTIWIGGVVAGSLYFVLRQRTDPDSRYRWCVGALVTVVAGGIVAWAVLQKQPAAFHPADLTKPSVHEVHNVHAVHELPPNPTTPAPSDTPDRHWTTWLALVWLAGMTAMLARSASLVADAERLQRAGRPLENEAVLKLIAEARLKMGLVQDIKVVLTERLTSPAVMGVLVPVLILPLSMVTTLPMEQLQLILLHELAHIRRRDYLVNLCQLLTESLLFFNPAVWWISRQIRQEREACCDAMAIALAGGRLQYARTLAEAAGASLAAAPAFSDKRNPSGLKDRIQRLLVPGYRPALRLTWCAFLAAFFVGGALLFLSAVGARATVALLTPQQRMDRIEKRMTELGEKPVALNFDGADQKAPRVKLSGIIRTADGSPVAESIYLNANSSVPRNSTGAAEYARNGKFDFEIREGTIVLGTETKGFAPVSIGPLDGLSTNRFEHLELVLQRGFDARLELYDVEDGKPVPGAKVITKFSANGEWFEPHPWKSGPDGSVTLAHCADFPLNVQVNAAGYEITEKDFDHVRSAEPLRVALRHGAAISGLVLDKVTGRPIAGAQLQLLYQTGAATPREFGWADTLHGLGKTDSRGRFNVNQLRSAARYFIGFSAPNHESVRVDEIAAGQSNLIVRLGPELIVRGRIIGETNLLEQADLKTALQFSENEIYENNSYQNWAFAPVHFESGVLRFAFTNRDEGTAKVGIAGQNFEREVHAPVDDWVIQLTKKEKTEVTRIPTREVVFRFHDSSGASPRGTASVVIPDEIDPAHATGHMSELEITNGEVRAQIPIGGRTGIQPQRMVGYWFSQFARVGDQSLTSIQVPNGQGPVVIDVPVLPAGAIYAKARNADGTPAGGLFFGITEVKRAPGREESDILDTGGDGFSDQSPRRWVSGPLPLGGTYQVHAWRNNSFCASKPIKLTEAKPDADVELQFSPGKTIGAVILGPNGEPLRNAELKAAFQFPDHQEFALNSIFTDDNGRFQIENSTPESGTYFFEAAVPGVMAERLAVENGFRLQVISLKQGRRMAGRVVESGSNRAIPGAVVFAYDASGGGSPTVKTTTDSDGRFEFTTLGDISYYVGVEDAQRLDNEEIGRTLTPAP
jgi:beta-lactamase regulating signal transducer with metallopeptidase domain/uncharacterized GH25 family protein